MASSAGMNATRRSRPREGRTPPPAPPPPWRPARGQAGRQRWARHSRGQRWAGRWARPSNGLHCTPRHTRVLKPTLMSLRTPSSTPRPISRRCGFCGLPPPPPPPSAPGRSVAGLNWPYDMPLLLLLLCLDLLLLLLCLPPQWPPWPGWASSRRQAGGGRDAAAAACAGGGAGAGAAHNGAARFPAARSGLGTGNGRPGQALAVGAGPVGAPDAAPLCLRQSGLAAETGRAAAWRLRQPGGQQGQQEARAWEQPPCGLPPRSACTPSS